jgi:hypothetical protein
VIDRQTLRYRKKLGAAVGRRCAAGGGAGAAVDGVSGLFEDGSQLAHDVWGDLRGLGGSGIRGVVEMAENAGVRDAMLVNSVGQREGREQRACDQNAHQNIR